MKIDLSEVEVFDSNKIDFDRKITFIFGKNGTGKSTITEELRKLKPEYDVFAFQGFSNILGENKQLNAVVLGEENKVIDNQIKAKKAEIETKNTELESIVINLKKPKDDTTSNLWTRKTKAEEEYKTAEKKMDEFYSQAAATIKKIDKPRISSTTYYKKNFQDDIAGAIQLSDMEVKQNADFA